MSLFPIVSDDGVSKPAVLLHVEELDEAGIEEICIVVQETDLHALTLLFHEKLSPQNFSKLNDAQKRYAKRLSRLGLKVKLLVQKLQEGMGHAVLTAREFVNKEPFLLVIAHHLMTSTKPSSNCFQQTLKAFDDGGAKDTVAVRVVDSSAVSNFGIVTCAGGALARGDESKAKNNMSVTKIVEKPTPAFAAANLRTGFLRPGNFLSVFGIYILHPHIFDIIKSMVDTNNRTRGQFSLTEALNLVRRHHEINAILIEGNRYDLTSPEKYASAVQIFAGGRGGGKMMS